MADDTAVLSLKQGDTFRFEVTCNDDNGDPVDLTGVTTVKFQLRQNYADREVRIAVSLTLGSGLTILTPANGKIQGVITASQTAGLQSLTAAGETGVQYRGELEVTMTNGDVVTVWDQVFEVIPEVTR